jgi:pimeloyl-ACP methyl ester carboxylesterase
MKYEPFTINVPDVAVTDLDERLKRTRLAPDFANEDWSYGTNSSYLQELLDYWSTDYDWREHEASINRFANYKTTIEGIPIHFIYERGKGPNPVPLVLSHGWPWTFWDWHKLIGPLTDPAAYGGDPADSFDVVIPSLPGFGFSTPLTTPGINFWRTADLWVTLMRDVLGYDKFAAGGGDWGALLTAQLGHKYAQHLIGVYMHLMAPLDLFNGALPEEKLYGPGEEGWYQRNQDFFAGESGYSAIQSTKPQTLAFALNDSPAGLCAWILEKRRTWSDCEGDVERRFSKDDLLTTMSIYWFTQSFGTSARYYYECVHNPWQPSHDRTPVVEAPTGIGVFLEEVIMFPQQWAKEYYNLQHWQVMESGGHFAPMEEPQKLSEDMQTFFRTLR